MNTILEELRQKIAPERVLTKEPMKKHTTFRIGGEAELYIIPETIEEVQWTVKTARKHEIPMFILGNGSNLLVGDRGIDGIVLQIYKNMNEITVHGTEITAQAGALLSSIAREAQNRSLSGFEFAGGIPGTFGGAITMNAGAYGGEMIQVLKEATVLTKEGEILTLSAEELELGYRTSNVITCGYTVLSGTLSLKEGDPSEIKKQMDEYSMARKTKQPLELPSAGSTFKRPEGYFAGKLIDDAGLRGYQVGGARVSDKHCGFVVNQENATAKDVLQLIEDVQKTVKEKFGVDLEPEVKRVGKF